MSFKRERGISLETLHWERASSRIEGRILWFSSRIGWKFGVPIKLRRGPQGPAHITSWKSGLILSCDAHLRIPHKSLQGRYSSDRLVSRNSMFLSSGDRDLGIAFKVHLGSQASSRVEAKHYALLSSCNQYSWSPLSDLKEVKPPMEL